MDKPIVINEQLQAQLAQATAQIEELKKKNEKEKVDMTSKAMGLSLSVSDLQALKDKIKEADDAAEAGQYSKARLQLKPGVSTIAQADQYAYDLLAILPK